MGSTYVRFHHGRGRNGRYTPRELRTWADRLRAESDDVYVYFNNDWEGFAIENARSLLGFLAERRFTPRATG